MSLDALCRTYSIILLFDAFTFPSNDFPFHPCIAQSEKGF